MEHAQIGATPDGGINREALTLTDKKGRDLFAEWCTAEGMEVSFDELGNMFATLPGSEPDLLPIATGSHLDTQPTGGKFDGIYGVLSGLEVVRTLRESGVVPRHPLTVVNWTAEEGSRFVPSMASSGVYAGVFSLEEARSWTDRDGIRFVDAVEEIGYRGEEAVGERKFSALIELHIEQGPVLEKMNKTIGLVTGAQAMSYNTVSIVGQEGHAGTVPMDSRLDPISAFLRIATACESAAHSLTDARFTVGEISAEPGSHSVIPQEVKFALDLRHPKATGLDELVAAFDAAAEAEWELGFTVERQEFGASPELAFDPDCVAAVSKAIEGFGYSSMPIVSGAGHDSLYVALTCPTSMIFVPCKGGISHNPAESITPEHAEAGANILLNTILNIDHK